MSSSRTKYDKDVPRLAVYGQIRRTHAFLQIGEGFNNITCSLTSPPSLYIQWSFGVVCWEVFSLGSTPYPGVGNHEVSDYIGGGHRLKIPKLCPPEM
jgi:hypothetical protein